MRILIASIVLIAVNAAIFVPALQEFRSWAPLISLVVGAYLLIQGALLPRQSAAVQEPGETTSPPPAAPAPKKRDRDVDAHVIHFLGLLQEKGRLVDFVMDDITAYSNEQVGAAARVVHQGCAQVIQEHLTLAPVHSGEEGTAVTLENGYDSTSYRAVGKLAGNPPFKGTLLHHGWKTTRIDLPRLAEKPSSENEFVITPAEVEIKSS